jgi:ubiquinone/menaquinone biosynthesis C-methylase UbiE
MISKPDYSKCAENYDAANDSGAEVTSHSNQFIEKILKKYNVKSVLDLTCGTGSQVFWLVERGYEVIGSDISAEMLRVAKRKAKKLKMKIKFLQGDMCDLEVGKFDAVITIFNAVGHLSKAKFEKAMRNIRNNLKDDGIYVFDIFNANMNAKLEAALKVDMTTVVGNKKIHKLQLCKINKKNGVMTMTEQESVQRNSDKPKITKRKWTMQVYISKWLDDMLKRNGFKVLSHFGEQGSKFSDKNSNSILTIAKKVT